VAEPKILKLLLVEDDLQDEQLVSEALIEIEENRQWCNWRTSTIVPVEQLCEATSCLSQEKFDIVLLNLSLPDSPSLLDTFLEVRASAPGVPIVVLADEPDENLANRLLREGAQDVLVKPELECAPFARSIRYAIERQRRALTLQASALVDELTEVLSRDAFLNVARHYTQLSLRGHVELLLASVEVPSDRESREPLLIQAAEVLRSVFEAPSVIGRWGRSRFAVITAGLTRTTVEAMLNRAAALMVAGDARFAVRSLDPGDNLEEMLADEHAHAKTAILAD
jgi:two-component system, cell cycle response regulator